MALHHRAHVVRRPGNIESFFKIESLEQRQLLTTLHGGEVFEFFDPRDAGADRDDRRVIRVSITGGGTIELIGGIVDEGNNLSLADIPGRILASIMGRAGDISGGLGGGPGLEAIGPMNVTDPINGPIGTFPVPDDDVEINALASNADGDTYAFHVLDTGDDTIGTLVQLLQVDTLTGDSTVVFSIQADLPLNQDGFSTVTAIPAADFNDDTGLLYFVTQATVGDEQAFRLHTVDVNTGVVTTIAGTFDGLDVHGIAFDGDDELHAFVADDEDGFLVTVNPTNTNNLTDVTLVTLAGEDFNEVNGIEIRAGELTPNGNLAVYAVNDDQLFRIDRDTGAVFLLGDLALPDGPDDGDEDDEVELQGFSYNPTLIDPFTGELGAMIATDVTSDQLVYINLGVREGHQIYNIHVTHSTPDTVISIAMVVDRDANPEVMQPFNGSIGQIRVINAQNPGQPPILVGANDGTGQVLLGQLQVDIEATDNVDESLIPILSSPFSGTIGTRAPGVNGLRAGLVVSERLVDYLPGRDAVSSMIQSNLDRISGIAVRNNGQVWVIDDDRVDAGGTTIDGDEMALINPATGLAGDLVEITDSATGDPLGGLHALAWGDPDGDGAQRLYAVYEIGGVITLGTISTNRAGASYGEFTAIGPVDAGTVGVQAMAFLEDRLFIIDNAGDLSEIDPADGSLVNMIRRTNFNVSSMAFDADGTLFVHDLVQGRLLDVDIDTGVAGGNTKGKYSSLPVSISGISFDAENDRFLAIDNSTGYTFLRGREGDSEESSSLVVLRGTGRNDSEPQDIGRFLFGGTITGNVDVSGSVGLFYTGWLITGNANGDLLSAPTEPQNFKIGGDLRDLVVLDSIGTHDAGPLEETTFLTGFDMRVGGRLGQVKTYEHFLGSVTVANSGFDSLEGVIQHEVETRGGVITEVDETGPFPLPVLLEVGFQDGYLVADDADDTDTARTTWNNDTFGTPQYLGTINSSVGNDVVHVAGGLVAADQDDLRDYVDYYAVGLMAGQTVQVQLVDLLAQATVLGTIVNFIRVGVYDPDGRLIYTDYSDVDPTGAAGAVFQFVTEKPGAYRFAVAVAGDADFNGPDGEFETANSGALPYELRIKKGGAIALGGLSADDNIFDGRTLGTQVMVQKGDLGAISAGAFFAGLALPVVEAGLIGTPTIDSAITGAHVEVTRGNLRAINANDVGRENGDVFELWVDIDVPRGSVGLVQATNALILNATGILYGPPAVSVQDPIGMPREAAIGGDYQLIHAGGTFAGSLMARRRIGVIRAGDMETLDASFFVANADNSGRDGIIDMIDVYNGDMGTLAAGGPAIITGPGGNVRYIRVDPGNIAYRDRYFGGGAPEVTTFDPGAVARLVDDSGTKVTVTPTNDFASITAATYGIRGSGGSALVSVASTGGINVRAEATSKNAAAEIGTLTANGSISIGGTRTLDVFETTGGNFFEIINTTDGEMVGGNVGAVGTFSAESIGVAKKHAGTVVAAGEARMTAFPFLDQRSGFILGAVGVLQTRGAMGNIQAGSIQQLVLDSDRKRAKRSFDGIVAPVFAFGDITDVTLGAGIMGSGTANFSRSGLYANGTIGEVRGFNSIVAGNIVSQTAITRVHLTGDSAIINANFEVVTALAMSREFADDVETADAVPDTVDTPVYDIGEVFIDGPSGTRGRTPQTGGIIGSLFLAADIGDTRVRNGFGLINSVFTVLGDGRMKDFTIDGYGIRDTYIVAGAAVGKITLGGSGNHLPATRFAASVRQSENRTWNPYSQFVNNALTDLHAYLGTDADNPVITAGKVTSSGVFGGSTVLASRNLDLVTAFQIRGSNRLSRTPLPTLFPSRFDVANKITRLETRSDILDTEITTGQVDFFQIGRDAKTLDMTVAGLFSSLRILGDLATDSLIRATGPDGEIKSILIGDDLDGAIRAERKIGRVSIGDEANSTGTIMQRNTQIFPAP